MLTSLDKKWASDLNDTDLVSELLRIGNQLDQHQEAMRDPENHHGGSPGEWLYERYDELENEVNKRGLTIKC